MRRVQTLNPKQQGYPPKEGTRRVQTLNPKQQGHPPKEGTRRVQTLNPKQQGHPPKEGMRRVQTPQPCGMLFSHVFLQISGFVNKMCTYVAGVGYRQVGNTQ